MNLLYFCVATPEAALARIARRVAEGGHDVPEADARRRFARSIANLPAHAARCDLWQVFDANPARPRIVAEGRAGETTFLGDLDGLPPPLRAVLAAAAGP